jgi:acetyltransferase-like isoleucine patch superfamily enzyme
MAEGGYKVGKALKKGGGLKAYQDLVLGSRSLSYLLLYELVMLFSQWVPGALGLFLRKLLYPLLLGECGKGCLFGRGVSLRHPRKIRLGRGVIVDDHALLDAKGQDNRGLFLGDDVFIGRNTIVYTKGGDIELAQGVNVSHNCELFSSNLLSVGSGTFIAAYSYLLSGGEYDIDSSTPFALQTGTDSRGPTRVGADAWIAAHVVVADGSTIGDRAVVGAGSVVRGQVPPATLAAGTPAKVIRSLERRP